MITMPVTQELLKEYIKIVFIHRARQNGWRVKRLTPQEIRTTGILERISENKELYEFSKNRELEMGESLHSEQDYLVRFIRSNLRI